MSIPAITMASANSIKFSELGVVTGSNNPFHAKLVFRQKKIDKMNTELCQEALDRLKENAFEFYPSADAVIILNIAEEQTGSFTAIGIAIKYEKN